MYLVTVLFLIEARRLIKNQRADDRSKSSVRKICRYVSQNWQYLAMSGVRQVNAGHIDR